MELVPRGLVPRPRRYVAQPVVRNGQPGPPRPSDEEGPSAIVGAIRAPAALHERDAVALTLLLVAGIVTPCIARADAQNLALSPRKGAAVSLELLRQIAERRLPYTIYAPALIDQLRVLRAAGIL